MEDTERITALGKLLVMHGENAQEVAGQLIVLTSAIYALVRTHPDPEAYAKAFRSAWTQLGQQHAASESGPRILSGIDEALASLEGASRVPLHVRAPSAASPPDD